MASRVLYGGVLGGATANFDTGYTEFWDEHGKIFAFQYTGNFGPVSNTTVSTSTGVNPTETSYSLFGHVIPLSLGKVRIGGEIIAGPWVENGLATFCISFGYPADPADSRTLLEIAFDSEVVWENGSFNTEPFTYRYYPGTLTQAADPVEVSHYGADAVAYRPQILLWFENLPLASTKFQKIPYVAALIADSSAGEVNFGTAFEALAYSPWLNYTSADFETVDITDGVSNGGIIIAENTEFLSLIQQFGRFYRNWNILQTDKLRIVDHGARVNPDIVLDRSGLMNQITLARAEPTSVPRVLELSTIDPDQDYTIIPSKAVRTLEPVNVSASISTESVYLPVVMDAFTRTAIVTYTKYLEDVARKRISVTAMMTGLEIEPGDILAISDLGTDFEDTAFKVIETVHGANYSVEITGESYFNCKIGDPYWAGVVLLLGFEGVDGSTGAPGFTDESPHLHGTGWPEGGAQVDTVFQKFGVGSLLLNGGLCFLRIDPSVDWCLSPTQADVFTVECWLFQNTLSSSLIVGRWFAPGSYTWQLMTSGSNLRFQSSTDGSATNVSITSGTVLTTGVWQHLAVDKDATGKIRLYKNGVMVASATPVDSSQRQLGVVDYLTIGCNALFTPGIDGYLDELRITKGVCRYGSDGGFPVPTAAYPRGEVI
jgi:Concanavalin A-like lectin/glucanases superfamily/Putative phage tail protein